MKGRFRRGIPIKPAPPTEKAPWLISIAECRGHNADLCTHGTRVRGIAVWATEDLLRTHKVPPFERAIVFLPNPTGDWAACSLCGSLRNPARVWIIFKDQRTG